jgi:hypothetical protein
MVAVSAVLIASLGRFLTQFLHSRESELAIDVSTVAAALFAAVPLIAQLNLEARRRLAGPPEVTATSLDSAKRDFIVSLKQELDEERQRSFKRRMPVTCAVTSTGSRSACAFDEIPHHWPLIVFGNAGSGKSVIGVSLALAVLEGDQAELVPVILPAWAWRSCDEPLSAIAGQMCRIRPGLAGKVRGAGYRQADTLAYTLATDLGRKLLLIVDGLPGPDPGEALRRLQEFAGDHRPLVLLCRPAQYADALAAGGKAIGSAIVADIRALNSAEAAQYLDWAATGRWARLARRARGRRGRQASRLRRFLGSPRRVRYVELAMGQPGYRAAAIAAKAGALEPRASGRWLRDAVTMTSRHSRRGPLDRRQRQPGLLLEAVAATQQRTDEQSVRPWRLITVMPAWRGCCAALRVVVLLNAAWAVMLLAVRSGGRAGLLGGSLLGRGCASLMARSPRLPEHPVHELYALVSSIRPWVSPASVEAAIWAGAVVVGLVAWDRFPVFAPSRAAALPVATAATSNPAAALSSEQRRQWFRWSARTAVVALGLVAFCGSPLARAYLLYALCYAITAALLGGPGGVSKAYAQARLGLWLRGRTEWRMCSVLERARQQGLLFSAGDGYGFRDPVLAAQLADRYPVNRQVTSSRPRGRETGGQGRPGAASPHTRLRPSRRTGSP